jgi:RHS repeat-associated protein
MTSVGSMTYTWDANGNLLSDGVNTYTYDASNRLKTVSGTGYAASYTYNGQNDRLSQTVNSQTTTYTLDLHARLTQVLSDGENTYLYGRGRIGEEQPGGFMLHLGDALGSVRQVVDGMGEVTLAKDYEPYGEVLSAEGGGSTSYAFTGEMQDSSGLVFLRARYFQPSTGRFQTQDTWSGDYYQPMSFNAWLYGYNNPVIRVDPSGYYPWIPCELLPSSSQDACLSSIPQPPLINPDRAAQIQSKLDQLAHPENDPGWDAFVKEYKTMWAMEQGVA